METAIQFFVHQGSYALMIGALIVAGLGVPLPEDIVMISGAILAQRHLTNFWLTVISLAFGVLVGDTVLFFTARRVGTAIYNWKFVKRMMPPARRDWMIDKIDKHGGLVVFCARNVAGFRGPTFAMCAIHGISYPRFILWDMLALTISMPLWMGLGWFFGDSLDQLTAHTATAERIVTVTVLGGVLLLVLGHTIVSAIRRRRRAQKEESAADPSPP